MSIIGTRPPLISETNLYVCWGLTPLRKRSTQIFRNLSLRLICILSQIANTLFVIQVNSPENAGLERHFILSFV